MKNSPIKLKSPDDIKRIHEAGFILSNILNKIKELSLENISTWELDSLILSNIIKSGSRPAFMTVKNYNYASCISVNDEVVHGIPSKKKIIQKGDIVKIDIGIALNGYFADSCKTYSVGKISENASKLISATKNALHAGIKKMYPGNRIGDIGYNINNQAEKDGFKIVKKFCGHGVGFSLHEAPLVPHYGMKNHGIILQEGMVLALEPVINQGNEDVITDKDSWTVRTADKKLSAQFEHTVAITKNDPLVLTE